MDDPVIVDVAKKVSRQRQALGFPELTYRGSTTGNLLRSSLDGPFNTSRSIKLSPPPNNSPAAIAPLA